MPHSPPASLLDNLALARKYAEFSVIVTDSRLDEPGPVIVHVNEVFTRMTGYSAEEVLGRSPRFLQGPDTRRDVLDRLRSRLSSGQAFVGRTVNYRKDGEPFMLEWVISHIRDADHRTTHFLALQRDISAQTFAEAELRRRDAELLALAEGDTEPPGRSQPD